MITRIPDYFWTVRSGSRILCRETSRAVARAVRDQALANGSPAELFRQSVTLGAPELYTRG
jgi:hypothetical protein